MAADGEEEDGPSVSAAPILPAPDFSPEFKPDAILAVLGQVARRQIRDAAMPGEYSDAARAMLRAGFAGVRGISHQACFREAPPAATTGGADFGRKSDFLREGIFEPGKMDALLQKSRGGLLAEYARFLSGGKKKKPKDEASADAFDKLVERARRAQCPDGLWRRSFKKSDNASAPDTCASALLAYGLAWGVNQPIKMEWLDVSRMHVIRAWQALVRCVEPDGKLRFAGDESRDEQAMAAGAFLLAGSEVFRMARAMTEPLPFVLTEKYRRDLEFQKDRIAGEPPPTRTHTLETMKKVCAWQQEHLFKGTPGKVAGDAIEPDKSWFRGALFAGVIAAARATNDDYYWNLAREVCANNRWQPGPNVLHDSNDFAITQTYLQLFLKDRQPERIEATRAAMDSLIAKDHPGRREWSWADALFMAPAAWAQMTAATGEVRYLDRMNRMWWDSVAFLYDPEEKLFYRDATYKPHADGFQLSERNGKKIFWGRGNGWVAGGICNILQYFPKEHPDRKKYESLLKDFAASLARAQGSDGLWRASLLDPDSYPLGETSGSAFFCYAIAWGINHGILDRAKYLPVAAKAWHALMACVEPDGKLGFVQLAADSPRSPTFREKNVEYAAGAFLMAGSEMIQLLEK